MNRQTKALKKLGLCTTNTGAEFGGTQRYEVFKGKMCVTCFKAKDRNPQNKRKSPWGSVRAKAPHVADPSFV